MEISIKTDKKEQAVDITQQVQEAIKHKKGKICFVYCPHTTAGLLINEGYDEDVILDIFLALDKIVPKLNYKHKEGNSKSHIKASLFNQNIAIPIENGKLNLGTWQKIFFMEFDGPKERKLIVRLI